MDILSGSLYLTLFMRAPRMFFLALEDILAEDFIIRSVEGRVLAEAFNGQWVNKLGDILVGSRSVVPILNMEVVLVGKQQICTLQAMWSPLNDPFPTWVEQVVLRQSMLCDSQRALFRSLLQAPPA